MKLTINDFKTRLNEEKEFVYLFPDVDLDKVIYRYLEVPHLIGLLNSNKLYVSNRNSFKDMREHGKRSDIHKMFDTFTPFARTDKDGEDNQNEVDKHNETKNLCISCWTYGEYPQGDESILAWRTYGINRIRIETTVRNLINCIKDLERPVIIGSVKYNDKDFTTTIYDKIFWKHSGYQDEQELRICVLSTDPNFNIKIEPQELIQKIRLSPGFDNHYREFLKTNLNSRYPFLKGRIEESNLFEFQ